MNHGNAVSNSSWDHNAGDQGKETHLVGGVTPGVPTVNNEVMIAANVIYKF